jgi:hypothetical protein
MSTAAGRETDEQRRQRHMADTFDYAARAARDPELARRVTEARSRIASGDVRNDDLLDYEELLRQIDELRRQ